MGGVSGVSARLWASLGFSGRIERRLSRLRPQSEHGCVFLCVIVDVRLDVFRIVVVIIPVVFRDIAAARLAFSYKSIYPCVYIYMYYFI